MKKLILSLSVLSCFNVIADSNSPWIDSNIENQKSSFIAKKILKKRSLLLDETLLKSRLNRKANKFSSFSNLNFAARSVVSNNEITLPLPDGTFIDITTTPSQVISDEMAEAYPDIKTWKIRGVDNPEITGVLDFTSKGFHGMLMMPDGDVVFIDPDKDQEGDIYSSISKKENADAFNTHLNCDIHDGHTASHRFIGSDNSVQTAERSLDDSDFPNISITDIKTYRLALSATAEYTLNQGGFAGAQASMVTSINRINPIFERDLGISLQLIDAPELIFSDASTDPFPSPNSPSQLMIDNGEYLAAQNMLDEFDIGHVLSHRTDTTGGSGVAFLKVACLDQAFDTSGNVIRGLKAAGATTSSNPTGETFDLVLLAHELGHQLGANHSFNSANTLNCSNGRSATTAVEPGSGSTVMSYNGLCGTDDLPENPRDDFFHFASISQVIDYTRLEYGSNCGTIAATGTEPTVDAGSDINIPANTPFILDGSASGGTASWDQIDIGNASQVDIDNGDNPIIRHIIPTEEQDRYIPRLSDLFAGTTTKGEIMPTTTRELNFAYVVRDDAISSDKKLINVTDTGSVFSVTSQVSGETFTRTENVNISWNTASTEQTPINCSSVDIQLLREDGVKNMLLASTPNDGSQSLIVPATTPILSEARVFVGCSDNSFFNISSGSILVQDSSNTADTTNPVITILGVNPANVIEGGVYTDEGATAIDNVDGALIVTSSGTVDTDTIGTYLITYSATDAAGNTETSIRTVVVSEESIPDITAPVITLNGDDVISVAQGISYTDAGATAIDDVDGSVAVESSGSVVTDTVGTYTITYSATDAAGNNSIIFRTVIVTEAPDTTAPQITVIGNDIVSVNQGEVYTDQGATALDNKDGVVAVSTSGSVNSNTVGVYTITYSATDDAGNEALEIRVVNVIANATDLGNNLGSTDTSESSGGGSVDYWLLSLLALLGFRRAKPVKVPVKTKN